MLLLRYMCSYVELVNGWASMCKYVVVTVYTISQACPAKEHLPTETFTSC